jgi:hypothetical protein
MPTPLRPPIVCLRVICMHFCNPYPGAHPFWAPLWASPLCELIRGTWELGIGWLVLCFRCLARSRLVVGNWTMCFKMYSPLVGSSFMAWSSTLVAWSLAIMDWSLDLWALPLMRSTNRSWFRVPWAQKRGTLEKYFLPKHWLGGGHGFKTNVHTHSALLVWAVYIDFQVISIIFTFIFSSIYRIHWYFSPYNSFTVDGMIGEIQHKYLFWRGIRLRYH